MEFLKRREPGYAMLAGTGAEIGGFEHPAAPPHAARVIRCDRLRREEAGRIFPEVNIAGLPEVDLTLDLDQDGLKAFPTASLDFVICCHVLEHLKNPIHAVGEIFRVLRPGGRAALAIPDRNYTFDRNRPLTDPAVLVQFFRDRTATPTPDDYRDIITYIHPQMQHVAAAEQQGYLEYLLARREHLNIWDTPAFLAFLGRCWGLLGLDVQVLYESTGGQSQFEYFAIIEKRGESPPRPDAS